MSSGQTLGAASYARAISGIKPSVALIDKSRYGAKKVKKEKKKMGWFKRKFAKWVREAWDDARTETVDHDRIVGHDSINGKTSVRFTIYPASGGYVVEHYKQDRYKENDGPSLTIVNNGDSLGTAVEHILTMEALKA